MKKEIKLLSYYDGISCSKEALKNLAKQKEFLKDRIEQLDVCIHKLEATANHFYSTQGQDLKGWNLLLGSRDKIVKLRDKDLEKYYKLDNEISG